MKAMIWDVDGTLVDSEELHRVSFNKAFDEFGLNWHWDRKLYKDLLAVTGGKERMRHYCKLINATEQLIPISVAEIHSRKTSLFHAGIKRGDLQLRKLVKPILDGAAANGIRLAIATTTTASNVEALLSSGVLNHWDWEVIVAGDQVENKKPAPDVYIEALRQLGLNPEDCLAIEDSENGLKSACAAGIPTVITPNRYTENHNFSGAINVIDSANENQMKSPFEFMLAWYEAAPLLSTDCCTKRRSSMISTDSI